MFGLFGTRKKANTNPPNVGEPKNTKPPLTSEQRTAQPHIATLKTVAVVNSEIVDQLPILLAEIGTLPPENKDFTLSFSLTPKNIDRMISVPYPNGEQIKDEFDGNRHRYNRIFENEELLFFYPVRVAFSAAGYRVVKLQFIYTFTFEEGSMNSIDARITITPQ